MISEQRIPIRYKDAWMQTYLKCDLLIENCIVVELKSVDAIKPIFEAQLFTYMNILKVPKGILINFNCLNIFKEGQKTYVNEFFRHLPE